MAVNKKTGKIVRPKTLGQKIKAASTRASNRISGKTKPRKPKTK
jgi:hypothetical protein